jgi:hypothetical protein
VGVIDKGIDEGHYYFVMEFVDGVSLRDLIDRGEMTPEQALALVPPLCEALEYAHSQGVIHRDVKPGNILIDDKGRIKIADFGLARIVRGDLKEDGLSKTNLVMGTPDYMAPEQRENPKSVDHRADIYSLGVVIYEMLTGTLPLGRFDPPSRSVGKNVRLDVRLDEVVLRALERDRDRRYQRASEVASAITEIGPQPLPAAGPAPIEGERGRAFALNSASRIEVRSEGANVLLRGADGPAEVSGDGRIEVTYEGNVLKVSAAEGGEVVVSVPRRIPAAVTTLDAQVRGTDLSTSLSVRTVDGDIELAGLQGSLRAESDSGNMTLRRLAVTDLKITGGDSDVLLDGFALRAGSGHVSVAEGDVRVNVDPQASSFRFRLHSHEGDVRSPVASTVGQNMEGRIGEGDGWLQVESLSGDVVLDVSRAAGPAAGLRFNLEAGRKKKGAGWGGFGQHLGVFVIVCGGLGLLNYVLGGFPWSLIVAGGWGMGLGLHFWSLMVHSLMGVDMDDASKSRAMERGHRIRWRRPWVSFSRHLGSYVAVNGFLLFLNIYWGGWPTYLWCLWPAGFWGIGLALHGWSSFTKWMRELWSETARPDPPTLDAVLANRRRVVRGAAGFVSHLGAYAVVCGFIVGLNILLSGALSWALYVVAGWGIGVVTGFWNGVTDVLEYISMEKAYRAGRREGEEKRKRVPLLGRRKWIIAVLAIVIAGGAVFALNWNEIQVKRLSRRLETTVNGEEIADISEKLLAMDRGKATDAVARAARRSPVADFDRDRRALLVHDSVGGSTYMVYSGPRGRRPEEKSGFRGMVDRIAPKVMRETYTFGTPPMRFSGVVLMESEKDHALFILKKGRDGAYLFFRMSFDGPKLGTVSYGEAQPHEIETWRTLPTWPPQWK